jgi:anti-sigma factor RsiW
VNAPFEHVQEDLTALLDGALPASRQAEVEAHLAGCPACRAERDRLSRALAALSELPAPPAPAPGFEQRFYARLAREAPRRRTLLDGLRARPLRWLAPAAGVAAALAVVGIAERSRERADLELAGHLDLLENYVEVASLDLVHTPEDVDVVVHLDELPGGHP